MQPPLLSTLRSGVVVSYLEIMSSNPNRCTAKTKDQKICCHLYLQAESVSNETALSVFL